MRSRAKTALIALALTMVSNLLGTAARGDEVLPSWRDTPVRAAILDFVARTTDPSGPDFVPVEARVAVFDNDGNLWAEQPVYFQLSFALDRLRALAPSHPEWRDDPMFKAALAGDRDALGAAGMEGLMRLVMASHAGMSTTAFEDAVSTWLRDARHPRFKRPYTDLVYQPMLELLAYLEANGFTNWIVSGGGVAFLRTWAPERYGIPPERIIGSRLELAYRADEGGGYIERRPHIAHVNDGAGKPVGIQQVIGRRPVFASGNSDGDLEMLAWTTTGDGPRFGLLVHHTDAEREWAYDRESAVGRLDRALDLAPAAGWTVVDMARDWARVFAFEAAPSP